VTSSSHDGDTWLSGAPVNRPLVVGGVLAYSVLVGALRYFGVIGTTGTVILFAVMVVDLVATHWLLRRVARKP
jgi:hypothetical protein